MKRKKQNRQSHYAISSGIRIELEEYAGQLQFEDEHKLGTGAKSIDLLIRKKKGSLIHKNIGRIFRGHNLFEIKGMTDYVSIDAFYRSCGYGLFYKGSGRLENRIEIGDVTFSFVTRRMPRKLFKHMEEFWGLKYIKAEEGIYYLEGARIPTQFIVTSRLNPEDNLWLKSLLGPVESRETANRLLWEYEQHEGNYIYEEVMQQIICQNTGMFKEEEIMCEALMEILEEKAEKLAEEKAKAKIKEYKSQLEKRCRAQLEEEYKVKLEEAVKARLEELGIESA